MFLCEITIDEEPEGFPRVRGDVPPQMISFIGEHWFSPRARGCSTFGTRRDAYAVVFPACAGMFRRRILKKT